MKSLALLLILACRLSAAVAVDARTTTPVLCVSTAADLTFTVGAGSNRALVAQIHFASDPGTVTVTWDNGGTNQAMTQIISASGTAVFAKLWGLVAPTSGTHTLHLANTNPVGCNLAAISFTGASQVGGATTFPNSISNTGTSTTATVVITSATGNWTTGIVTTPSADPSSPTQTQDYIDLSGTNNNAAGSDGTGAATVTHTWTLSASNNWIMVGTDVAAVASAAALFTRRVVIF